jgi:hypothetical protein
MSDSAVLKRILLLAANPKETASLRLPNLRLQEEEREIKHRLRLAGYGKVPIASTGATRPRDIQQAMLDFKPQIVHFIGHGLGQNGLAFEDESGQPKLVGSEALAKLFELFSSRVECVILNACYSKFQAEAISQHINYVVGMSQAIKDRAAIEFSVGFYAALGAGESLEFAYKLGCNAIQLEGIPEHLTPVLFTKKRELTKELPNIPRNVSSHDLIYKGQVPGAIKVIEQDKWTHWVEEGKNIFITSRTYDSGRIMAVGHEGVLIASDTPQNKEFLEKAFEWLSGSSNTRLIVFSTGHCESIPTKNPQKSKNLFNALKEWKYKVKEIPEVIDSAKLESACVLVIGNAWGNLIDSEVEAIRKFVSSGGGLFVAGLGWSWKAYSSQDGYRCEGKMQGQDVEDLTTYPMNQVVEPYEMMWTETMINN